MNNLVNTLIPALAVHDGVKAIAFYQQAFGATELYRLIDPESGKIGHAELLINGSTIALSDEYPAFNKTPLTLSGTAVKFTLMVDDVDVWVARSIALLERKLELESHKLVCQGDRLYKESLILLGY